jgi:hypothetical protein
MPQREFAKGRGQKGAHRARITIRAGRGKLRAGYFSGIKIFAPVGPSFTISPLVPLSLKVPAPAFLKARYRTPRNVWPGPISCHTSPIVPSSLSIRARRTTVSPFVVKYQFTSRPYVRKDRRCQFSRSNAAAIRRWSAVPTRDVSMADSWEDRHQGHGEPGRAKSPATSGLGCDPLLEPIEFFQRVGRPPLEGIPPRRADKPHPALALEKFGFIRSHQVFAGSIGIAITAPPLIYSCEAGARPEPASSAPKQLVAIWRVRSDAAARNEASKGCLMIIIFFCRHDSILTQGWRDKQQGATDHDEVGEAELGSL